MSEQVYAVLDDDGNVVNTIVADDEFIAALPDLIDDPEVNTDATPYKRAFRVDNISEPVGMGWRKAGNGKWMPPPPPTAEEQAAFDAAEAKRKAAEEQRQADDDRLAVLRGKVGPGKPGLTPAERDELNLIIAMRG